MRTRSSRHVDSRPAHVHNFGGADNLSGSEGV